MSQVSIGVIWSLTVIILAVAVLLTCYYYHISSLISITVISSRNYEINQLTQNIKIGEVPRDIQEYVKNHPESTVITEILIKIDNQSPYTYEWDKIKTNTQNMYVYYPYTISVKNNIWKGESTWTLLVISDKEIADRMQTNKNNCSIELVLSRPLLLLSKRIM